MPSNKSKGEYRKLKGFGYAKIILQNNKNFDDCINKKSRTKVGK
jgi:hypothetical protein